jgi:ZIP family zinc transporter
MAHCGRGRGRPIATERQLSTYLSVLALALLPALGNLTGSAIAELARTPSWIVGAALHAAAGIALALVSIELLPRALEVNATWLFVVLLGTGALLSYLLAQAAIWLSRAIEGGSDGAWMVYTSTAADLLSDGLMTGASAAVSTELGLLIAFSQLVGNLPGGFATISNFRSQGVSRHVRLISAASFVVPVLAGVTIGFMVLRGASAAMQGAALSVIVGILLVTTIEDLVPQADQPGTSRRISTASFVGGFGFFALLAANSA